MFYNMFFYHILFSALFVLIIRPANPVFVFFNTRQLKIFLKSLVDTQILTNFVALF